MSPPPHREKDAKVEGRDLPETAPRGTMAPFKNLLGKLLKVKPDEVEEQQRLYEQTPNSPDTQTTKRKKRKKLSAFAKACEANRINTPPRR